MTTRNNGLVAVDGYVQGLPPPKNPPPGKVAQVEPAAYVTPPDQARLISLTEVINVLLTFKLKLLSMSKISIYNSSGKPVMVCV